MNDPDDISKLVSDERPPDDILTGSPLLENWLIKPWGGGYVLSGNAQGHPQFSDGRPIITSELQSIGRDRSWARTHNRHYRLGTPAGGKAPTEISLPRSQTSPAEPPDL